MKSTQKSQQREYLFVPTFVGVSVGIRGQRMDNPGEGDGRHQRDMNNSSKSPRKRTASRISGTSRSQQPKKRQYGQRRPSRPMLSHGNDIVEGRCERIAEQIAYNLRQSQLPPRISAHHGRAAAPNESPIVASLLPTFGARDVPPVVTRKSTADSLATAGAPSAYRFTPDTTNFNSTGPIRRGPPSVSDSDATTRTSNLTGGLFRPHAKVVENEASGPFGFSAQSNLYRRTPRTQQEPSQMEQLIAELVATQGSIHSAPLINPYEPRMMAPNLHIAGSRSGTRPNPFHGIVPASGTAARPPAPAVDPPLIRLLRIASGQSESQSIETPPNPEQVLALLASRARTNVSVTAGDYGAPAIPQFASATSVQPPVTLPLAMPISEMQRVAALATLAGISPNALAPTDVLRRPSALLPQRTPGARTANLYMPATDAVTLSPRQVLLRQQIEYFEAGIQDIRWFSGREISIGQVGIRCKHCAAALLPQERPKGTVYFPSTLRALYQAAQNMGTDHFIGDRCQHISPNVKGKLKALSEGPTQPGFGGKKYWADGARLRGIHETEQGLRFHNYVR